MLGRRRVYRTSRYSRWSTPHPFMPVRRSVARRILRRSAKTMWWLHKRGWARRRPLAPLYGTVATWVFGAIAHAVPEGWRSVVLISVLAAGVIGVREQIARHQPRWLPWINPRPLRRNEWIYTAGVWGGTSAWLTWAAIAGPMPPRAGWLLVLLAGAWIPALWRYRTRRVPQAQVLLGEFARIWEEHAACSNGIAPDSIMHNVCPLDPQDPALADTARIELPRRSKVSAASLVEKTVDAAMLYDVNTANIALEQPSGMSPRWVDLTVFNRNPLEDTAWWPGPSEMFNHETGVANVARYATGGTASLRYYGGAGIVHDMIAGVTGSGKSALNNALLAIERDSPWMASIVLDPQAGQSLPTFVGQVAMYGRSITENAEILKALVGEMLRRNQVLSDVKWTDGKGRDRTGIDSFDPRDPIIQQLGMKLIVCTIEEAAMQLAEPDSFGAVIALATMARKCGIKLRMVFQTPLLDQVRSNVIRDQLLGGNVIVFRTGSPVSGQVVLNGVLPASPHLLPREWPDGSTASGVCYILGPGARSVIARTYPIEDVYHWATTGETTMLPEVEAILAAMRHDGDAMVDAVMRSDQFAPATAGPAKRTYGDVIVEHLQDNPYATTGSLAAVCGVPDKISSISTACARLAAKGLIVDHGHGMWGSLDTAGASAEEVAA